MLQDERSNQYAAMSTGIDLSNIFGGQTKILGVKGGKNWLMRRSFSIIGCVCLGWPSKVYAYGRGHQQRQGNNPLCISRATIGSRWVREQWNKPLWPAPVVDFSDASFVLGIRLDEERTDLNVKKKTSTWLGKAKTPLLSTLSSTVGLWTNIRIFVHTKTFG